MKKANTNTNTNTKKALLLNIQKMMDAKAKWIDCVENKKPLSSLKEQGILLEKLG